MTTRLEDILIDDALMIFDFASEKILGDMLSNYEIKEMVYIAREEIESIDNPMIQYGYALGYIFTLYGRYTLELEDKNLLDYVDNKISEIYSYDDVREFLERIEFETTPVKYASADSHVMVH